MIEYTPDLDRFVAFGLETGRIDARVIAFLKANPDTLYTPDPPTSAMYPCPRTWEKLSRILKATNSPDYAPGVVGPEVGARFIDFWPLLSKTTSELLKSDPAALSPAERAAAVYVLSETAPLIAKADKRAEKVIRWIEQLDPDLCFVFVKSCVQRLVTTEKMDKTTAKKAVARGLARLCRVTSLDPETAKETLYGKATLVASAILGGYQVSEDEIIKLAQKGLKKREEMEGK